MKISDFYNVVNPDYVALRIIPHTSIRNYNSSTIAKTISNMYKTINDRIKLEQRKLIVETKVKCCYIINITKDDIGFYFLVPYQYQNIIKEKILSVWKNVKIEINDNFNLIYKGEVYYIMYKNNDCLSLDVDRKDNYPLNNILNVTDLIKEDDSITIINNIIPTTQWGWSARCEDIINKYNKDLPVTKNISCCGFVVNIIYNICEFLDSLIDELFNNSKDEIPKFSDIFESINKKVSNFSEKKRFSQIVNTQIIIVSYSKDKARIKNNGIVTCQAYEDLKGDNSLMYEKSNLNKIDASKCKIDKIPINKFSTEECQHLFQLPARDLLQSHNISHNNVTESNTPKELQDGIVRLGENIKDGNMTYLSTDKELQFLTLCIIAPTRGGKTTYITNMCYDYMQNDECSIIFDWCGKCSMSDDLQKAFPNNVLNIDCSDIDNIQGLGYNELYTDYKIEFEQYRSAKHQASQLLTLINSVTGGDEDLRSRMERYLSSASIIVGLNKGSAKDVLKVLQNYNVRHEFIDLANSKYPSSSEEHIENLLELDKGNGDTNITAIQGILNRVNKLKENPYMELMLKKDCKNNFNLVDMIQKPQIICIRMPEIMFNTEQEKDTYATYWFSKVWCALQQRQWFCKDNDMRKVNLFFDELYQTPKLQALLSSKLSQIAKFGAKNIITCHSLNQISIIKDELKSANTSYMLISGVDVSNYSELKKQLLPYTEEDIVNLKRYHSLNLIKYNGGYAKFITKLPKPIR